MFPGQGSQAVGMGRALATTSAVAWETWQEADDALGEAISQLAWDGPAEVLDQTINAQPAMLAASIAAHRALLATLATAPDSPLAAPTFYVGHSMGQYSAMVAAGVLELGDAARLVRERGRLMQASSADGAMAAIIGLPDERLDDLVTVGSAAGIFTLANRNSPGQVVVSGERVAVEAAAAAAKGLGARLVRMLPVSVAAHSPLMAAAAQGMPAAMASVTFRDPRAPLLANADATPLTTGAQCRAELIDHLTRGVDWVRAVQHMAAAGVRTFVEVGPGKVLSSLVKRIDSDATIVAIDDLTTPNGLVLPSEPAAQE